MKPLIFLRVPEHWDATRLVCQRVYAFVSFTEHGGRCQRGLVGGLGHRRSIAIEGAVLPDARLNRRFVPESGVEWSPFFTGDEGTSSFVGGPEAHSDGWQRREGRGACRGSPPPD